ncbi:GNAT family N-acetyltransferase [Roseivivax sp. THAF30]|uniref:GNAT family N-acetyltransferase n=1 Tax=Roseivivax sp. THAF30 TaxID=2587852 RepID=UPI0012678AE8|nr:GNAT family N-acetyltransferase [Roseivivax sp. THAF30]QFT61506.1 putative N-acetyltransferase YsnE [Roseivivax sp. THAF30]
MEIVIAHPSDPSIATVLRQSHALMQALFPPEHNSFLDLDALAAPGITLWAARDDSRVLGTVALMRCDGYGEVKSLFVTEAARGTGLAHRILEHLEGAAAGEGIGLLRLETGNLLDAAARLYTRMGYVRRGPFGEYRENGTSVFYEKPLIRVCS